MKRARTPRTAICLALAATGVFAIVSTSPAQGPGHGAGKGGGCKHCADRGHGPCGAGALQGLPRGPVDVPATPAERAALLRMREEEKVARDVYSALAEKWQLGPHSNIRHAEQRHMDAMLHLVTRYGIEDPVQTDEPGKFQDPELQKIYDSLLERGSRSAQDALRVGCDVEQLDIHDLHRFLESNHKDDIRRVFEAQIRASRNHLRAFNRGLVAQTGSGCEATYLDAGELSEIVQSPRESCGGGGGQGGGGQGGPGHGQRGSGPHGPGGGPDL